MGERGAVITYAFNAYQAAAPDANCYLIDITDADATLTEDLDGDASYTTYSYDGLHPNQAGHDLIADLVSEAIDALGVSESECITVSGAVTVSVLSAGN